MKKRFLIATIGSLGDLHPCMGLAKELIKRGHSVVLATSLVHREYVERAGISFCPIRPEISITDPRFVEVFRNPIRGAQIMNQEIILPASRQMFDDLLLLARDADVLVSSLICYVAPIVAKEAGIPWVSSLLSPMVMWSGYDPPVLAPIPFIGRARFLPYWMHRGFLRFFCRMALSWAKPLNVLRREYGLPKQNPFWDGFFSPYLTLCHWWEGFGPPQLDWPPATRATGFIFYDPKEDQLDARTETFLQSGPAPVVFTLGSTIIEYAEPFLKVFLETIKQGQFRAIVTVGTKLMPHYENLSNSQVHFCDYAPYGKLFKRASLIVHQGGVGTTAQALSSGHPMIVLSHCMDQLDNAARVQRLGAGVELPKKRLTSASLTRDIHNLLADEQTQLKCQAIAKRINDQTGAATAATMLERLEIKNNTFRADNR